MHRLPSLRAYCPDLILIAAGFDGAAGDTGNTKLDGRATRGGMDLLPDDFDWVTSKIVVRLVSSRPSFDENVARILGRYVYIVVLATRRRFRGTVVLVEL